MDLMWMLLVVVVWLIFRLLQTFSRTEKPKLYYKTRDSPFIRSVLDLCPIFSSVFRPTLLWGKSGHFQTIFHSMVGRTKPQQPDSVRHHIVMPDGATMSYNMFDPHQDGVKAKFTLALCPGIANSSENISLRTFAAHAQSHGYRVAILNHLGALKSEPLTAPRIFSYGGTDEYSRMVDHLLEQYPDTKILAVGLSMGGNIITKYLGESEANQHKVLCGVSVCQGYHINECKNLFLDWSNLRRVYCYLMTWNKTHMMSRHRQLLFSPQAQKLYGQFDEEKVFKATSLLELDFNFSSFTRAGYCNIDDYYHDHSSAYYIHNIKVPMLFMNSLDDPVVPEVLLKYPRSFVEETENCILLTTKHGGHLGYFEGGFLIPHHVSWLDRIIIEYSDAITSLYLRGDLPSLTGSLSEKCKTNPEKETQSDNITTNSFAINHEFDFCEGDSETLVRKRVLTAEEVGAGKSVEQLDKEEKEKRDSLKRGSLLQQATSYVQ